MNKDEVIHLLEAASHKLAAAAHQLAAGSATERDAYIDVHRAIRLVTFALEMRKEQ